MAHTHRSDADDDVVLIPSSVHRWVWAGVAVCGAVVLLGLVLLWPSSSDRSVDPLGLIGDPIRAQVNDADFVPCSFDPLLGCWNFEIIPSEGEYDGERLVFQQPLESPIRDGDTILVDINVLADGSQQIIFYDFERSTPLSLLLLLFVTAIVVLGGWRGLGALAGLAASLFIIVVFLLPALLAGSDAVTVALVAAGLIAFIALFLAHGFNLATAAALLSSFAALGITALLAWLFVVTSNLTGLADETIGFLGALQSDIDPRGLLLAGIVIGSLGVLDDVTVTQISAVWELKRARPDSDFADLYRRAVRIGRDHISSTVNTLFLAYAGAALPLLLLFREAGQSVTSVATREVVAVEIVRALVGSIGLVSSVPISTALAAAILGTRNPPGEPTPTDVPT